MRELRDRDGVDAMHALEARQLLDALAEPAPSVISAAASTVEVAECRAAMRAPGRGGRSGSARRPGPWPGGSPRRTDHRPEYGASPEAFLAEQAARRDPLMASLDPIVIDVDAITPARAAAQAMRGAPLASAWP